MSMANMHWEEKEGVELYMSTATSSVGKTLHCNSTNSTCQFSNLHCGETYEFSVTAYSNMCHSEASNSVEIQTGMFTHSLSCFICVFSQDSYSVTLGHYDDTGIQLIIIM